MQHDVITLDNKKAGEIELSEHVFGTEVRKDILHRVVLWQLAGRRQGTHKVKERGEVRGTTAKMYKQKGTGRARHGSRRVGQFVGGGVTFGPRVRTHNMDLPKKVRKLGLRSALSAKLAEGKLVVLESLDLADPKTKALVDRMTALGWTKALVIDGDSVPENFARASSNIPGMSSMPSVGANVYDILNSDTLALTRSAVAALEARLS